MRAFLLFCVLVLLVLAAMQHQHVKNDVEHAGWQRTVNHSSIHGDQVVYTLESNESSDVYLLVFCKHGHADTGGLKAGTWPLRGYVSGGDEVYALSYKTLAGAVGKTVFDVDMHGTRLVTNDTRETMQLRPLVGSVIELTDMFDETREFHFPAAGLLPYEGGCKQ